MDGIADDTPLGQPQDASEIDIEAAYRRATDNLAPQHSARAAQAAKNQATALVQMLSARESRPKNRLPVLTARGRGSKIVSPCLAHAGAGPKRAPHDHDYDHDHNHDHDHSHDHEHNHDQILMVLFQLCKKLVERFF